MPQHRHHRPRQHRREHQHEGASQDPACGDLPAAPALEGYPAKLVDHHTLEVQVEKSLGVTGLFRQLDAQGIEVLSLRSKSNRLEELFVSLVEKNLAKVAV